MKLTDSEMKTITQYIVNAYQPLFIYLFGSFARGEGREDSDVDIALYAPKPILPFKLYQDAGELGYLLKRDVQLIDLHEASTVFAAQIVGTREELYCSNVSEMELFNMKTLKMYAKLNEERQPILDAIREEGTVYGR